jgi:hypothetical protein
MQVSLLLGPQLCPLPGPRGRRRRDRARYPGKIPDNRSIGHDQCCGPFATADIKTTRMNVLHGPRFLDVILIV